MSEVFELVRKSPWDYQIVPPTRFKAPYDDVLRSRLALAYIEYAGGVGYDGGMVCLEGISSEKNGKRTAYLSVSGFFDFINCNIVGREAQDPSARIYREMKAAGATPDMIEMISILGANYASEKKRIQCFEDVLETSVLPNTIATSILVYDEAGNYLLSRRTDNVIIGKKFYGVTASGSVDPADLAKIPQKGNPGIDPFCSCAARELAEETTLGIPDRNFKFRGLVIGKEKLQPIAIVDALSPNLFDGEWRIFDPSDGDPDAEVAKIVSVPQSKLVRMPEKYEMTEAASYHMRIHAENT